MATWAYVPDGGLLLVFRTGTSDGSFDLSVDSIDSRRVTCCFKSSILLVVMTVVAKKWSVRVVKSLKYFLTHASTHSVNPPLTLTFTENGVFCIIINFFVTDNANFTV